MSDAVPRPVVPARAGAARFGVELHQYLDAPTIIEEGMLAEALGYRSVWLGDSQLIWRELFVLLGALAARTTLIHLGTGVTNPVTRHPSVIASAAMTLQELSGGRTLLGVGSGFSAVATVGLQPSTSRVLEGFITSIRGLCAGAVVARPDGGTMRLAYGGAAASPPIIVGASGPKMLWLAGAFADGVIIGGANLSADALRAMVSRVQDGRRAGNRLGEPFTTYLAPPAAVDDDPAVACAAVRSHVVMSLLKEHWPCSSEAASVRERLRGTYNVDQHLHPRADHAASAPIPDSVVREFALAGTAKDLARRSSEIFELGIDEIIIRPYGAGGHSRAQSIERFADGVVARFR